MIWEKLGGPIQKGLECETEKYFFCFLYIV